MKVKGMEEAPEAKIEVFSIPGFNTTPLDISNDLYVNGKVIKKSSLPSQKLVSMNQSSQLITDPATKQFPETDFLDKIGEEGIVFKNKDLKNDEYYKTFDHENLIRLFFKKDEFIYARSNDILMIESCDHLVKVYIGYDDKVKKTIRCNTLKDFLGLLPQNHFFRVSRFCAINLKRISGGDYNQQTFEFDYKISIKLKHPISRTYFNAIGK